MQSWNAQRIDATDATLGEGISWEPHSKTLLWVDIPESKLNLTCTVSGTTQTRQLDVKPGAAQRTTCGEIILATSKGFALYDWDTQTLTPIIDPEEDLPQNRFNDGKIGPDGRFYAGTLQTPVTPRAGSFWVLDASGSVHKLFGDLTISNGLDWSPDLTSFYHIDTPTREVSVYSFDPNSGALGERQTLLTLPEEWGYPDGMTVDAEGNLWIAHYNGGRVSAWNPATRSCFAEVLLPVSQVTCCCFGGEDMQTLYITTAREGDSAAILQQEPAAGALFKVDLPYRGRLPFLFKQPSPSV